MPVQRRVGAVRLRRSGSPLPARRVRAVAVLAAAVAVGAALLQGGGAPVWWALPALAVAVAAAELAVVHLQFGRQRWTLSLTEAALGAAWVVAPGAWTVAAVAAGVAVAQLARHQPRLKLGYNIAQLTAAAALGSATAVAAGPGIRGAVAGVVVFFAVNHSLVGVAVSLTTRRRVVPLLASSAPLAAVHTAGNASIGLLAAHLALTAPLGLLALLVPLALLWSSYHQQTRRSAEVRLFAELARGQQRASGRSSELSADIVLTAAARLLGGADVEMLLLAADGPVRYTGDETGVRERRRVDAAAFDAPWVVRALERHGVTTGTDGGRPCVSAVVGDPGAPLAVLHARRPRGSAAFGRREVQLAQVLVTQAEAWLEVADLTARTSVARAEAAAAQHAVGETARALGELGAATAPALRVLHESADRLARLAERAEPRAGVDAIVDELHQVERAVASLLGALVLAAEPDLRDGAVPVTPGARATDGLGREHDREDWTTTGLLE